MKLRKERARRTFIDRLLGPRSICNQCRVIRMGVIITRLVIRMGVPIFATVVVKTAYERRLERQHEDEHPADRGFG